MIAHATEEQVTPAVTSRTVGKLQEAVLPRGPTPGGQFRCNGTPDTTPPTSTEERCFLFGPLRGYITRPTEMFVEWSGVELTVRRQLGSCSDRRQPASTWNREHGSWGIYGVGSRYQTTTGEHTADWEDLARIVINCTVCELTIALQLLVITIRKCSVNPITNPNPSTVTRVTIY
jgi:hypothetical protein